MTQTITPDTQFHDAMAELLAKRISGQDADDLLGQLETFFAEHGQRHDCCEYMRVEIGDVGLTLGQIAEQVHPSQSADFVDGVFRQMIKQPPADVPLIDTNGGEISEAMLLEIAKRAVSHMEFSWGDEETLRVALENGDVERPAIRRGPR